MRTRTTTRTDPRRFRPRRPNGASSRSTVSFPPRSSAACSGAAERRLLAPGVVELERAAQLLEPITGELREDGGERGFLRPRDGFEEGGLGAAVGDLQGVEVDDGVQPVSGELLEDFWCGELVPGPR